MGDSPNDRRGGGTVGTTCAGCRYPLAASRDGACPECGLPTEITRAAGVEAALAPLRIAKIGWTFAFVWAILASLLLVHSALFWSTALIGTDYYTSSIIESRWIGSIASGTRALAQFSLPTGLFLLATGSSRELGLGKRASRVVWTMVLLVLLQEIGFVQLVVQWIALYAGDAAERAGQAVRYGASMALLLWFRGRFAALIGLRLSAFLREAPFVATLAVMVGVFLVSSDQLQGGSAVAAIGLWALVLLSLLLQIELIRSMVVGLAPFRRHQWRRAHEVLAASDCQRS